MSASTTRVFGMKVGVDPKILVGGLIAFAAILFWYNSRSDDVPSSPARPSTTARTEAPASTPPPVGSASNSRSSSARRSSNQLAADRGTLRLRPVDATRGDIDPTLHLDLLSRLQAVGQAPSTRSLFEIGATPPSAAVAPPIKGPVIMPKPLPGAAATPVSTTPGPAPLNIPLRYYGFVRPAETGRTNSGLFLDGDNVLVVSEGQVVKQRFLIVELTPTGARLEDVQLRQGQTLPVVPVANP
ncbi:MAG: hypothetical protein ACJ74Y_08765 [Bryobacteraceae bacterium]